MAEDNDGVSGEDRIAATGAAPTETAGRCEARHLLDAATLPAVDRNRCATYVPAKASEPAFEGRYRPVVGSPTPMVDRYRAALPDPTMLEKYRASGVTRYTWEEVQAALDALAVLEAEYMTAQAAALEIAGPNDPRSRACNPEVWEAINEADDAIRWPNWGTAKPSKEAYPLGELRKALPGWRRAIRILRRVLPQPKTEPHVHLCGMGAHA